jgi:gluconolactonase
MIVSMPVFGIERDRELSFQGVYRIEPQHGLLKLVCDDFEMPNGLCLTPDESRLLLNDTPRAQIRVFDVAPDGSLSGGRIFFERIGTGDLAEGVVEGMKLDERGNVYVTGPAGSGSFRAAASISPRSSSPRWSATSIGVTPTGRRSTSARARRSTGSE